MMTLTLNLPLPRRSCLSDGVALPLPFTCTFLLVVLWVTVTAPVAATLRPIPTPTCVARRALQGARIGGLAWQK